MLTVIVKGTNGCNLACSYCSLGRKTEFQYADTERMTDIFIYSCEVAVRHCEKQINFILHGGEPTLIDAAIYQKAVDTVRHYFPDMKIVLSMQTNGWVLSDTMLQFIKDYDVHIGISLDGSAKIHDLERKSASDELTYQRVIANMEKLRTENIGVSCLMVLTRNAFREGYEFVHYFAQKGIHLKINPLLNYGEVYEHPELSLNLGDYAKYLIGLYEYVIENDIQVQIAPIDHILQAIINHDDIHECSFSNRCNQNFLCIDLYGDIYPCGKFSDMKKYKLGNVQDKQINIFDSHVLKELVARRNSNKPEKCNKCKYVHLCHAGCNAEACIDGDISKPPVLCTDYQMLFEYFHKDGLKVLKRELMKQRKMLEEARNGI